MSIAGKRYFPEYYTDDPLPSDILLQSVRPDAPFEVTRIRPVTSYLEPNIIQVQQSSRFPVTIISGHCKRREDTDMFEHPYFSPNYLQMPSNYSSGPSYWLDTRRTKDELSRWANDGIRHDRAFGEWHNVFGTRYFYGDTRRL
ncbi:uncharacterized protein LOC131935162 isoform X1 [Physella acuta]|uniref:uncharacterized protein LOC131935162 isoform X1 n=1 Tax=Physella acuta TaxID=109671 RepID=UPI0027DE751C|nr:uncharacterized protein LOC131935162 isoform X1 [Physella acuta]